MDAATEKPLLREFCLITLKPLMYVANVAEGGFKDNPYLAAVEQRAVEEPLGGEERGELWDLR